MSGEVRIERVFQAPRELVFRAWTDPDALARWYAPHGCTYHLFRFDFHVGGTLHSCIRSPEHGECWIVGRFTEVVPPERFSYVSSFSDAEGNVLTPAQAGRELDWPAEITTSVAFEAIGDRTKVTIYQTVSEAHAKKTGAYPSWLQMLDRLDEELAVSRFG